MLWKGESDAESGLSGQRSAERRRDMMRPSWLLSPSRSTLTQKMVRLSAEGGWGWQQEEDTVAVKGSNYSVP